MTSEVAQWRLESEQQALARLKEEQRLARMEDAQLEERFRFKPWDPFGKPGAGAPMGVTNKRRRGWGFSDTRFELPPDKPKVPVTENFNDPIRNSLERGKVRPLEHIDYESRGFLDGFGQPGAGAPLRTESGNVITAKYQHDDLIMQANIVGKKTFLNAVPPFHYDPTKVEQYRRDLDRQYFQKVLRLTNDKQRELQLEQMTNKGLEIPERNRFRNEDPLRGRLKPKQHISPDDNDTYNPWGKSNPERDADGYVKKHKHQAHVVNGMVQLIGDGEESTEHQRELKQFRANKEKGSNITIIPDHFGQPVYDVAALTDKFELFDPFGKPGAGAPRRDEYGNVLTRIPRFEIADPVAEKQKNWCNKVYLNQIKEAMKEHQIVKSEWNHYDKAECENFAEIVDRSIVGKVKRNPNTGFIEGTPLASTEITRPEVADIKREVVAPIRHKYYEDLKKQVEDNERRTQLDQIRERQEANQHYDTAKNYWFQRGGGAALAKSQPNTQTKHRITDEHSSNIYEAFYQNDGYTPMRQIDRTKAKHESSAKIRRVNSESSMLQTGPSSQNAPQQNAYLTDGLYVPSGGLGYYGHNILPPSGNSNYYAGAAYSFAGQNLAGSNHVYHDPSMAVAVTHPLNNATHKPTDPHRVIHDQSTPVGLTHHPGVNPAHKSVPAAGLTSQQMSKPADIQPATKPAPATNNNTSHQASNQNQNQKPAAQPTQHKK